MGNKNSGRRPEVTRMRARVEVAARMLARGESWGAVAERLGYKNRTSAEKICHGRYREYFLEELDKQVREWVAEGMETQALGVMSKLMEGAESPEPELKKIAEAAAHSILGHAAKMRGTLVNLHHKVEIAHTDENLIAEARRTANAAAAGK